ncbi:hypothetical protein [Halorubrum cibi]|uniref:DUF8054 domain-containing protein n=1 Tax=Halorubrum cibi TaxID=413815 RepID=A0A521CDV1_9EURY|nr:hypothetical protein [Halorubrum cibi]SMO57545.1 hypothetical protein SAMN06264867_104121 [Halorubrum cibi]
MRLPTASAIRRPAHTGENRCWPCTTVNVAIVAIAAAALTAVGSPAIGGTVALAGLALVWLRGYVVPGTPRFAPRLVAPIPGSEAVFHGVGTSGGMEAAGGPDAPGETDAAGGMGGPPDGEAGSLRPTAVDPAVLLDRLVSADVLAVDGDTVAPTAAYDERWGAEMDRLRDRDTESLAEIAREISPATTSRVIREDREWIALASEDATVMEETWIDRPTAIAEIAGYRAAEPFLDDDSVRLAAARTNRMFLDRCPDCETELERGVDMPCCGGYSGPGEEPAETLVCPACEVRLYTFEPA